MPLSILNAKFRLVTLLVTLVTLVTSVTLLYICFFVTNLYNCKNVRV